MIRDEAGVLEHEPVKSLASNRGEAIAGRSGADFGHFHPGHNEQRASPLHEIAGNFGRTKRLFRAGANRATV
jgi:hypothetical protein